MKKKRENGKMKNNEEFKKYSYSIKDNIEKTGKGRSKLTKIKIKRRTKAKY